MGASMVNVEIGDDTLRSFIKEFDKLECKETDDKFVCSLSVYGEKILCEINFEDDSLKCKKG
ncbi:MAG: hypothetical protein DRP02_11890 [Candidatus Gerdarchaeota archaeon]|nr:MAG: hypothetical protein DRP02_11890 [Candidatus Gerdarchaeota archaeon]